MLRNPRGAVLDAVSAALRRAGVDAGSLVLAGVSGGADSVAMLDALVELRLRFGYRLAAAHLNHRIRAEESDRDECFVRDLCGRLGVELVVERAQDFDIAAGNLEERARDVRHAFFNRVADALGASHIALAHTADDQAETVLMRLLRGAGAAGLAAMAECGPGRIVRPMLALRRETHLAYLRVRGLGHVEDSSNRVPSYLRNRIRMELLPMLEREYAPGLAGRLAELASEMRALDGFVTELAARELDAMLDPHSGGLDLARLRALHPALQAAVLRRFIERRAGSLRRITRAHVEALRHLALDGPPNGRLALPARLRALREYERLLLIPRKRREPAPRFAVPLAPSGTTVAAEAGFEFEVRVLPRCDVRLPADPFTAVFDLANLGKKPLTVRNFIAGDRIAPVGMEGTRKLHDVFIDHKLPRARRASWPVVTLGQEVVWLPGIVRSRIALVTSATETALQIETHQTAS
jgi:tRNA(Ile)-lysidine synthase